MCIRDSVKRVLKGEPMDDNILPCCPSDDPAMLEAFDQAMKDRDFFNELCSYGNAVEKRHDYVKKHGRPHDGADEKYSQEVLDTYSKTP